MISTLLQELLVALRVWILAGAEARWIEMSDDAKMQLTAFVTAFSMLLFFGYYVKVHHDVDTLITQGRKNVASSSRDQGRRQNEPRASPTAVYRRSNNMSGGDDSEDERNRGLRSRSHSLDDEDNFGVDGIRSMPTERGSPSSSSRERTHSSDSERDYGRRAFDRQIPPDLIENLRRRNMDASPQDMSVISSIAEDESRDGSEDHLNGDPRGLQVIHIDKLQSFIERFSRYGVIVSVFRRGAFRKRCLKLDPTKRCLYWKDERRVLELRRRRREWPVDDVVSLVELGAVRTEEITSSSRGLLRRMFGGGQELLVARGSAALDSFVPVTPPAAGSGSGGGGGGSAGSTAGAELRLGSGSGSGSARRGSAEGGLAGLLLPRAEGINGNGNENGNGAKNGTGAGTGNRNGNGLDGSPRATLDSDTKHAVALKLRSSSAPGRGKVYQLFFESRAEAHWLFRHFASLLFHMRGGTATAGAHLWGSDQASRLQSISLSGRGDSAGQAQAQMQAQMQAQGQVRADSGGGSLPALVGDDDSVDTYQTYASSMASEGFQPPSTDQDQPPSGFAYQNSSTQGGSRTPATQTFQSLHPRKR